MKTYPNSKSTTGSDQSSAKKPQSSRELNGSLKETYDSVTYTSPSKGKGASKTGKPNRSKDPVDLQKRARELEQKLHLVDLSQKVRNSIWCSPLVFDMIDLIGEQLGIPHGDVMHMAIIMFYRQCFSDERRSINELGMLLKNLECQVEELGMEIQSLEETALTAVELELSPYYGSQDFDQ